MATRNDAGMSQLARHREITLTVTGRKSGRSISIPVWFVPEGQKLYLLPVTGSDTQWYQNILKTTGVHIRVGGAEAAFTVTPIKEKAQVASVVEKFRARYGDSEMKRWFSKLDVAAVAEPDR
jgi:deazaflavin-dependent oxidoreductase (nitroreductase family)